MFSYLEKGSKAVSTTKARKNPNHPRFKKVVGATLDKIVELGEPRMVPIKENGEEKMVRVTPKKEFYRATFTRRNGQTFTVVWRKKKGKKNPFWIREVISHRPEQSVIRRSHMPRIGSGTGQTERKPVKTVTETYTGKTVQQTTKVEYTYGQIVDYIRTIYPAFDDRQASDEYLASINK